MPDRPTAYDIAAMLEQQMPPNNAVAAPPTYGDYDTVPEFYIPDSEFYSYAQPQAPAPAPVPVAAPPVAAPAPRLTAEAWRAAQNDPQFRAASESVLDALNASAPAPAPRQDTERANRDAAIADVLAGYGGLEEALSGINVSPEELMSAENVGRRAAQVDAIKNFQSPEYPTPVTPNLMPQAAPMPASPAYPTPQMPNVAALDAAAAAQPGPGPASLFGASATPQELQQLTGAAISPAEQARLQGGSSNPLESALSSVTSGVGAPMAGPQLGSAISPQSEATRMANEAAPANLAPAAPPAIDFNQLLARLNTVGQ